jgi:uncharacterized protein (DUF2147 family)
MLLPAEGRHAGGSSAPKSSGLTERAPLVVIGTCPPAPLGGVEATLKTVRRGGRAMAAAVVAFLLAASGLAAPAADDPPVQGVWMIEGEVALAVASCGEGGVLCGRIAWLRIPSDEAGRPRRDTMNPDAALRDRPLCGVAVLDGLLPVPDEPGRWAAGSFYDPRDGRSYGLTATRVSADVLVARVYIGMPFLGVNQTLLRVAPGSGEGWC